MPDPVSLKDVADLVNPLFSLVGSIFTGFATFAGPILAVWLTYQYAKGSGLLDVQKEKNELAKERIEYQKEKLIDENDALEKRKHELSKSNEGLIEKNTTLNKSYNELNENYRITKIENDKAIAENNTLKLEKSKLLDDIHNLPSAILFFKQLGFIGEIYIDQKEYFKYSGFKKTTEDIINLNLNNLSLAESF
ncbi:hypothetical protein [Siphonobacter sp. SORGH_AS_1065]|uniref:hypothetical protein n=1 Tax=Siphonobacter sp. SORGH_AS_1065 TaxID=3041795 RepID=UPI0027D82EDA|nr:hypothetical protein [Siphonobacter sp. SORGH_AS_1065]